MNQLEHHDEEKPKYKRLTIRQDDNYFSVYCTENSLNNRYDDVMRWARRLAERLHWSDFQVAVTATSKENATRRPNAMFETHHGDQ